MVDFKYIGYGGFCLFLGFTLIVILNNIVSPLIEAGESISSSTNVTQVMWFGALLITILATIILPNAFIIHGLMQPGNVSDNKTIAILIGGLMFLFTILITVQTWSWVAVFQEQITHGLMKAVFYIGLLATWINLAIICPFYIITEATKG